MKQNILGGSVLQYRKKLIRKGVLCAATAALTLVLNILLTVLRTPENHNLFLVLNILSDIGCSWFLLFYLAARIIPQLRLFRLMQRESVEFAATVKHIAPETTRYMNMDCQKIRTENHIFFLPEGTLQLEVGQHYHFSLVSNTIVEVEL